MTSWLKAGLIGGAALSALYLVNVVSTYVSMGGLALACCCFVMVAYLLVCGGTGALTAHWMPAPRDTGTAAGHGALAGGLAGLIGGAVNAVAMLIQSSTLNYADVINDMPAETLEMLRDMGITTEVLESSGGLVGGLFSGACCCGIGVIVAVALGAIGGAIWAATRRNQ